MSCGVVWLSSALYKCLLFFSFAFLFSFFSFLCFVFDRRRGGSALTTCLGILAALLIFLGAIFMTLGIYVLVMD